MILIFQNRFALTIGNIDFHQNYFIQFFLKNLEVGFVKENLFLGFCINHEIIDIVKCIGDFERAHSAVHSACFLYTTNF